MTLTIAQFGLTTIKYSTALTLIVTLSSVITSCAGTSSVITRVSTRTIRSRIGMSRNKPGPRAPTSRPSRNTTPRSYSGTILIAENTSISTTSRIAARQNRTTAVMTAPLGIDGRSIDQRDRAPSLAFFVIADGDRHTDQQPNHRIAKIWSLLTHLGHAIFQEYLSDRCYHRRI